MLLAAGGIGIFGVAPTLTKNRKLFADIEVVSEVAENDTSSSSQDSLTDINGRLLLIVLYYGAAGSLRIVTG